MLLWEFVIRIAADPIAVVMFVVLWFCIVLLLLWYIEMLVVDVLCVFFVSVLLLL